MIKRIIYNWYYTKNGEVFKEYRVGVGEVIKIEEHIPKGEEDRLWYEVYDTSDKLIARIFNPNMAYYG